MNDPDLDPNCDWTGTPGTRSIEHIPFCPVCSEIWPLIAANPFLADGVWKGMLEAGRIMGPITDEGNPTE